ncbi:MAG: hypothetical protein CHACPFDD_02068 [Phycisphaerae bacterium]|nr:hypothetical protein [Phycisphaerae bacterium]
MKAILIIATALMLVALVGCATVNPRADYDRAARDVGRAVGTDVLYRPDDAHGNECRVTELLDGGLSADEAVQVALLNNPRLQAALFKLGISRADVVQSGLFSNPTLAVSVRWPDGGGLTNLQAGLAQNIAELWQIPYRQKAAERDLDRTVLDVAREASVLALDARTAYWRSVRAHREHELARENLELAQKLHQLAISRRDAGAGSDVDVNLAESQLMGAELKLRNAALATVEASAALATRLGIKTPPGDLVLSDSLAEPTTWMLTPAQVITAAMADRLDVQATRMSADGARARVELEKSRFLRSLELGVSTERSARNSRGDRNWLADTAFASAQAGQLTPPSLQPREPESTDWVIGPELGVELPLFDQNQAQIAKAEYVHQQALKVLDALERELAQEAYVACERATTAAGNARFYKEKVLPLRETGLSLAQGAYTAGRATLLSVQEAQRLLLEARAGYVEALTSHTLAIVELERVAGRPFQKLLESAASMPVSPRSSSAASQPAEDE